MPSLTLLLIEDHYPDAELISREVHRHFPEAQLQRVEDHSSFVQALKNHTPDIILSDYSVPGTEGKALLQAAKELAPGIPFVFISGTIGEERAVDMILGGAADYVLKDNLKKLKPTLDRILRFREESEKAALFQKQLKEIESRYRALFDQPLEAVYVSDLSGRFLDMNGAARSIFGWEPGMNQSEADFLDDAEMRARAESAHKDIIESGSQTAPVELRVRTSMGHQAWIEASGCLVTHEGNPHSIITVARDISERKVHDLEMRKLYTSLEQSGELILITDRNGRIEYANRAATLILGYSKEELIGHTSGLFFNLPPGSYARRELEETIEAGQPHVLLQSELRKDGDRIDFLHTVSPIFDDAGEIIFLIDTARDVTIRQIIGDRIAGLDLFDPLTNLPGRRILTRKLGEFLETYPDPDGRPGALISIDIDRYSRVNDLVGFETGDRILQNVVRQIQGCLEPTDILARIGDDHFVVFVQHVTDQAGALSILEKIRERFREPIIASPYEIILTVSSGLAMARDARQSPEEWLRVCEKTMERAAHAGRNSVRIFDAREERPSETELLLERQLFQALGRNEFFLLYQPYWNITNRGMAGMEALLRWKNSTGEIVSPGIFIPLLEETGLIRDVSEWILRQACRDIRQWMTIGLLPLPVSVNISPVQFRQPHLADQIEEILLQEGVPPQLIVLEITESVYMEDFETTRSFFDRMKAIGVGLSIDDFGTGYSSLSYLKKMPVDNLKIDISFVREIHSDPDTASIVTAIIGLANIMHLRTIAEGVETEEQWRILRILRADYMQGFLMSRPIDPQAIARLLVNPTASSHAPSA